MPKVAPTTVEPNKAVQAPVLLKDIKALPVPPLQGAAKIEKAPKEPKAPRPDRPKCADRDTCKTLRANLQDTDLITPVGNIQAREGTIRFKLMEAIRGAATIGAAKELSIKHGDREIKVTKVDVGFCFANHMMTVTSVPQAPKVDK
jgi:hypothetical protein